MPASPEVRHEIIKAMRTLAEDQDEALRRRRAEIESIKRDLEALRQRLAKLRRDFPSLPGAELRREQPSLSSQARKYGYNPDEPRVPARDPGGGQWTTDGGSDSSSTPAAGDGTPDGGTQYAALDTGTQTDASGSGGGAAESPDAQYAQDFPPGSLPARQTAPPPGKISASDIPPDSPNHSVLFVDSNGNPIADDQGNPVLRPANLPPALYVQDGRASGLAELIAAYTQIAQNDPEDTVSFPVLLALKLAVFGQGGSLDAERFQGQYVTDYRDYANIAIGLYMAAAGVDVDDALSIADTYAQFYSKFGPNEPMDEIYTHSAERDVQNIRMGYELYNSGRISS